MFELVKILWAGKNTLATGALAEAERQRVRAVLLPGEQVSALVRGRVKEAGAAFWVLTDQRLLVFELFGRARTTVVPLQAPMALFLLPGHYGATVALYQAGQRSAVYAADRGLAFALADALVRRVPGLALDNTLQPLSAAERDAAAQALAASKAALQAAAPRPASGLPPAPRHAPASGVTETSPA